MQKNLARVTIQFLRCNIVLLVAVGAVFLFPKISHAASLVVTPATGTFETGQTFTLRVEVTENSSPINAVSGALSYPRGAVTPVSFSKIGSIVTLWTQDPKSLTDATIPFEGIILNPGFAGKRGLVFAVTFQAKRPGPVTFSFSSGSILLNDGAGTNALDKLYSSKLTLSEPKQVAFLPDTDITKPTGKPGHPTVAGLMTPVIAEYSSILGKNQPIVIKGKATPDSTVAIVIHPDRPRSFGERVMHVFRNASYDETVKTVPVDSEGNFALTAQPEEVNVVAGVYQAWAKAIGTMGEKGSDSNKVSVLVDESSIYKIIIVIINVLLLFVPLVVLGLIVYFIPWYSMHRMKILGKRFKKEEVVLDEDISSEETHKNHTK